MLEYIIKSATIRANQLCAKFPELKNQREDIQQEIICHTLKKMDKYNEKRGSKKTFISKVAENAAFSYLRTNREKTEIKQEELDFSLDTREAIKKLPEATQKIANMLAAGYTIREIVEKTGESVGKIYRVHMPAMREAMQELRKSTGGQ